MKDIFALVDCNNFYASCERVFKPRLNNKPVIVLSNNDGCVVARSNEAKKLGIAMGVPAFEIEDIIEKHNVAVFSSNYALYADMSARVMETLSSFTPEIEIYSIDEAFLNLSGFTCDLTDYGRQIGKTVKKWTGIPVSVGIAHTKTLAKIANYIAKRSEKAKGVLDLTNPAYIEKALSSVPVGEVWGIGLKTEAKLKKANIRTALDLSKADISWIKRTLGITGVRTAYELRGIGCYRLEDNPPAKKSIAVTRTFGRPVNIIDELKEAAASYAAKAAEKLRNEKLAARVLTVFVNTSRFIENSYFDTQTVEMDIATNDTIELVRHATWCIERLYCKDCSFKKAGVILGDLVSENKIQESLFNTYDRAKSKRLMQAIDSINNKLNAKIQVAAEGLQKDWGVRFKRLSCRYTTRWDELPKAT